MNNFTPFGLGTVNIAATGTAASVALNVPTATRAFDVRVFNSGSVPVFIMFGVAGVAATTGNMPIAQGAVEVFSVSPNVTHVSAITAGTPATIYFTTGAGS